MTDLRGLAEGSLTERECFVIREEFAQRLFHNISVRKSVRLIVTTGQDIAIRRDDRSAPYTETAFAQFATMVLTVFAQDIPAVFRVRGHQRMAILIVVELGGLKNQSIGSEELVLLFESTPFVFVRF